jgi:isoleucyl-tRNA synthetase
LLNQELNVRKVTVTSDKHKYGVQLRAEPDHKVLGGRLKGAFKAVLNAIKELSDDQLVQFQLTGSISVAGHELGVEDLRIIHTFDKSSDDTPNHYEAHSDSNVRVTLSFWAHICLVVSKVDDA